MGALHHSEVTLRFFGDDLIPDEVSALLGAKPTDAYVKGQGIVGRNTGIARIARTGSWRLSASRREPEDFEAQIDEILNQITTDSTVWKTLSIFEPDLFCGAFMASGNDGLSLSSRTLLKLGERGIELAIDIYEAGD